MGQSRPPQELSQDPGTAPGMASGSALAPFLREARRILGIGLPIFIAQLSQIGMNFVDTVMTGHYSASSMAAVAVAGSVWAPAMLLAIGCLLALPGMGAQLAGARRPGDCAHLFRQGVLLALALSLAIGIPLWLLASRLDAFGLEAGLAAQACAYLRALIPGLPGFLLFICLRSLFEAFARTRPAMAIGLACLALNVPLNYAFIYGRLGMPQLGAMGCGVATAACYWFMALAMLGCMLFDRQLSALRPFSPRREDPVFDPALVRRLLRIGGPNALALCVECSLFALTAILLAPFGTTAVAGHQIAMSYGNVLFAVPLSISMTATIRVGRELGAGRPLRARTASRMALALGLMLALAAMLATLAFRREIVSAYTTDAASQAVAASLLLFCAGYLACDSLQCIGAGALRGWNDTRTVFLTSLAACGGLGLPLGFLLGRTDLLVPAMGAPGFWTGYIAAMTFSAACYLLRLRGLQRLDARSALARILPQGDDPARRHRN